MEKKYIIAIVLGLLISTNTAFAYSVTPSARVYTPPVRVYTPPPARVYTPPTRTYTPPAPRVSNSVVQPTQTRPIQAAPITANAAPTQSFHPYQYYNPFSSNWILWYLIFFNHPSVPNTEKHATSTSH